MKYSAELGLLTRSDEIAVLVVNLLQHEVVRSVTSFPCVPYFGNAGPDGAGEMLETMEKDTVDSDAGEQCNYVASNHPMGLCENQ